MDSQRSRDLFTYRDRIGHTLQVERSSLTLKTYIINDNKDISLNISYELEGNPVGTLSDFDERIYDHIVKYREEFENIEWDNNVSVRNFYNVLRLSQLDREGLIVNSMVLSSGMGEGVVLIDRYTQ
jgi:hypothetical protein